MAVVIQGKLYTSWTQARPHMPAFRVAARPIRNRIDDAPLAAKNHRYHLFVGRGDPWSHRVVMARAIKQLDYVVTLSSVEPILTDQGWRRCWPHDENDAILNECEYLYQIYLTSDPNYTGRITVPMLWDKHGGVIVNNESGDIVRLLNSEFNDVGTSSIDLYPALRQREIDLLNWFIFDNINNGVYKIAFATTQALYKKVSDALFNALDELDERLAQTRFLLGDRLTESDIRLFVTLVRFDTIYHPYLRCNRRRLVEYRHLWPYTRDIYQLPGVRETVDINAIKQTYYGLKYLNPTTVIPDGPMVNFDEPVYTIAYEMYSAPF